MNQKFYVESCSELTTSTGKDYLQFVLNDGETKQTASCFNPPVGATPSNYIHRVVRMTLVQKGNYLNIEGAQWVVTEWDDEPEDSPLRKIKVRSDITPENLIAAVEACLKLKMHEKFRNFYKYVCYKDLIRSYGDTPAGLKVHHSLKGGLIQHIYEMMSLYYNMTKSNLIKGLRHEFVVTAILFHDFGKLKEYDLEKWENTSYMPILGHIFMSAHMLSNLIDEYNRVISAAIKEKESAINLCNSREMFVGENMIISEHDRDLMVHCILAHHGQRDFGSPVPPCIPEAMVMHFIDQISGKMNMFQNTNHMEKNFFLDNTYVIKDYYDEE